MKKETITYLILIIVALAIIAGGLWIWQSGAMGPGVDPRPGNGAQKEIYITGYIYDISENKLLVAEGISTEEYTGDIDKFIGNAGWFNITEDTKIIGKNGEAIKLEELKLEERVAVLVDGLVMESYPAQATASKIEVLGELVSKECFVGGCSGELCSDDPEAMSTCELLPGMECLTEGMSCELVGKECAWVLSETAAQCFMRVREEHGEEVLESRIGYLFTKAEEVLQ